MSYYSAPYDYSAAGQGYSQSGYTVPATYTTQTYGSVGNVGSNMADPSYSPYYNYGNWQGYGYGGANTTTTTTTKGTGYVANNNRKKILKVHKEAPTAFHCDTCGVNCAGNEAYTAHITGRKHATQERKKLQSPLTTTSTNSDQRYAPYGTTTSSTLIGPSPAPGAVKLNPKFYCDLCNCSSTDQNTFNLHLSGKKHKTTLQKKNRAAGYAAAAAAAAPLSSPPAVATLSVTPPSVTPSPPTLQSPPQPQVVPDSPNTASSSSSSSSNTHTPQPTQHAHHTYPLTYSSTYRKNRPSGPFRRHTNVQRGNPISSSSNNNGRFVPNVLSMTATNTSDDNLLNSKHSELSPSSNTSRALSNLVTCLSNRLSELGKSKDDQTPHSANPVVVSEVKLVGAYARGTLMKHNPIADIVAITKDPPNKEALAVVYDLLMRTAAEANVTFDADSTEILVQENGFGVRVMVTWLGAWSASKKIVIMVHEEDKVVEEKKEIKVTPDVSGAPSNTSTTKTSTTTTTTTITTTTTTAAQQQAIDSTNNNNNTTATEGNEVAPIIQADAAGNLDINMTPPVRDEGAVVVHEGMEVEAYKPSNTDLAVVNTEPQLTLVTPAPVENLEGVNISACQHALMSIRQIMWFNEQPMPNLRSVIRLLLDFRSRVSGFQSLSTWALEVIVVNALRGTPQTASISQSLRSLFAYIASGVLLPGVELIDPCEQEPVHVLRTLTPTQRLEVTTIAQEVIREIAYGKWERIVGV